MSTIQEAKTARSSAKRQFTRKQENVSKALARRLDNKLIDEKFHELKIQWVVVQERHEDLLKLLCKETEEPPEDEERWLQAIQNSYD